MIFFNSPDSSYSLKITTKLTYPERQCSYRWCDVHLVLGITLEDAAKREVASINCFCRVSNISRENDIVVSFKVLPSLTTLEEQLNAVAQSLKQLMQYESKVAFREMQNCNYHSLAMHVALTGSYPNPNLTSAKFHHEIIERLIENAVKELEIDRQVLQKEIITALPKEFLSSSISGDSLWISNELKQLREFFQGMAEPTPTLHYGPS